MARKNVTITLYVQELIYDVQNKTYITGRSRYNGKNHEEVANMQANDDDENLSQIARCVQKGFSDLKTKLSEYITNVTDAEADNTLFEPGAENSVTEYNLTLSMPSNYNRATVQSIADNAHQYIVNSAIKEWFVITNKADANDYDVLLAGNLMIINEGLNKRVRPTKKSNEARDSRFD